MSLAKPISTSVGIRGIVFAILGVTGLGAALLNARWSRPGILVGLVFLFLAGITFSKATQIARFFRPFVKESVRVEVWGLPLPASSAAIFEIDSISAIGAGLLIQLRAASGGRRSLLKVAQPGSARLEEDRVEIGEAAYISWAGTKLRPPVGKKPPALVLLRRSNPRGTLAMDKPEIPDPVFREAVSAIDAGDVSALERLVSAHPGLVRDRIDCGEGYFKRPYLLWFVAENPVRNGRLPGNIGQVTRVILKAAQGQRVDSLREQLDSALALVCSGRVARECGVQRELIDVLGDAGADPDGSLLPALAHRELAAAERLLERGARLTLLAAACTGRTDDVTRLAPLASAGDRRFALAGAALYGQARALGLLIDLGVDLNAYGPPGFHPHATALHHAVDSGFLDAVRLLVEAGAELGTRDRVYQGTPLDWAEHLRRTEIAAYLREKRA